MRSVDQLAPGGFLYDYWDMAHWPSSPTGSWSASPKQPANGVAGVLQFASLHMLMVQAKRGQIASVLVLPALYARHKAALADVGRVHFFVFQIPPDNGEVCIQVWKQTVQMIGLLLIVWYLLLLPGTPPILSSSILTMSLLLLHYIELRQEVSNQFRTISPCLPAWCKHLGCRSCVFVSIVSFTSACMDAVQQCPAEPFILGLRVDHVKKICINCVLGLTCQICNMSTMAMQISSKEQQRTLCL